MKWSNYGSICAIQMKPGVKFPICALLYFPFSEPSHACRLLAANIKKQKSNIQIHQLSIIIFILQFSMCAVKV